MALSPTAQPDPPVSRQTRILAGFNGQLCEPSGFYLLGNGRRAYSPTLMRFNRPDQWSPFGRGGLNAYAYCSGDPVNHVDPSGRWEEMIGPVVTLAANFFLAKTGLYGIRSPNMKGPALKATYISVTGALVGMYGSVEQLLGNSEAKWINTVGTALAMSAAFMRSNIARRADKKHWAELKQQELAGTPPGTPAPSRPGTGMSGRTSRGVSPGGESAISSSSRSFYSARANQRSSMGEESIRTYDSGDSRLGSLVNVSPASRIRQVEMQRQDSGRVEVVNLSG